MAGRIYKPLMATMADDIVKHCAEMTLRQYSMEWHESCGAAARIASATLAAIIEDAEFCGDEQINLNRLRQIRNLLDERAALTHV